MNYVALYVNSFTIDIKKLKEMTSFRMTCLLRFLMTTVSKIQLYYDTNSLILKLDNSYYLLNLSINLMEALLIGS